MLTEEQLLSGEVDEAAYLRGLLLQAPAPASSSSAGAAAAEEAELARLRRCEKAVRAELGGLVQARMQPLTRGAQTAAAARRELRWVAPAAEALRAGDARLRALTVEPLAEARAAVAAAERAREALSLLGDVRRFLDLARRLRACVPDAGGPSAAGGGGGTDMLRAARVLAELEASVDIAALRGIRCVDAAIPGVERATVATRAAIADALRTPATLRGGGGGGGAGLSGGAEAAAVRTALAAAEALGGRQRAVQQALAKHRETAKRSVEAACSPESVAAALRLARGHHGHRGDGGAAAAEAEGAAVLGTVERAAQAVLDHTRCVAVIAQELLRLPAGGGGGGPAPAAEAAPLVVDFALYGLECLRVAVHGAIYATPAHEQALAAAYPAAARAAAALTRRAMADAGAPPDRATPADLLMLARAGDGAAARQAPARVRAWREALLGRARQLYAGRLRDRLRECLSTALARLDGVAPLSAAAAAQPSGVQVEDLRRPSVPPAAAALDLRTLGRLAAHLCRCGPVAGDAAGAGAWRAADPVAAALVADGLLEELRGTLLPRLARCAAHAALPPLVSLAGPSCTRGELLHVCVANGLTALLGELPALAAALPPDGAEGDDAGGDDGGGDDGGARPQPAGQGVRGRRAALAEMTAQLRALSERSSAPFLRSAAAALQPLLVEAAAGLSPASPAAVAHAARQVQASVEHYLFCYYYLVDRDCAGWAAGTRRLAEGLAATLAAATATAALGAGPGAVRAAAAAAAELLTQMLPLTLLAPGVGGGGGGGGSPEAVTHGRGLLRLKGRVQQLAALYAGLAGGGGGATKASTAALESGLTAAAHTLGSLGRAEFVSALRRCGGGAAAEEVVEGADGGSAAAALLLPKLVLLQLLFAHAGGDLAAVPDAAGNTQQAASGDGGVLQVLAAALAPAIPRSASAREVAVETVAAAIIGPQHPPSDTTAAPAGADGGVDQQRQQQQQRYLALALRAVEDTHRRFASVAAAAVSGGGEDASAAQRRANLHLLLDVWRELFPGA